MEESNESVAQSMTMMQDTFMRVVFEDPACVEAVIQEIFQDPSIRIVRSYSQAQLNNLFGKEVRLDVLSQDLTGTVYNIEPQEELYEARPERARYYGSMIDTKILEHGDKYTALPKLYVIFITDGDMFGRGEPLYTIERNVHPNGSQFPDGSCIMYLNSRIQDESSPYAKLMHDFTTSDPEQIIIPALKKRMKEVKHIGEDGRSYMCKVIDELIDERVTKARKDEREIAREEREKEIIETAKRMQECGMSQDVIAKCVNEPVELVKSWLL